METKQGALRRSLFKSQAVVGIGFMTMNAGNFATSLLSAWLLDSSAFSTLVAIQALLTIVTTVPSLTQPVIAARISRQLADGDSQVDPHKVVRAVLTIGLLTSIAWLALAPFSRDIIGPTSTPGIASGSFFLLAAFAMTGLVSVAQGMMRFEVIGLAFAVGGLTRPIIFCVGYLAAPTVWAAVLGMGLNCVVVSLVIAMRLNLKIRVMVLPMRVHPMAWTSSSLRRTISVLVGISVLTYCDVAFAKVGLPDNAAAGFAIGALFTNVLLYVSTIVNTVLVPRLAGRSDHYNDQVWILRWSLFLVSAISVMYSLCLYAFGHRLIRFFSDTATPLSRHEFLLYAASFGVLAIISVATGFEIARGTAQRLVWLGIAASTSLVGLFYLYGQSAMRLIVIEFFVFIGFIISMSLSPQSAFRSAVRSQ